METCTEHSLVHFKHCAMIQVLTAEGVCPIEIHFQVQVVNGVDWVGRNTVHPQAKKCKDGKLESSDLCDKQQSKQLVTAADEFHKKKVDELIKEN